MTIETRPRDGVNQLALAYYKIQFESDQRVMLSGTPLELIYSIGVDGTPTLALVNGIDDQAIIDSLIITTNKLPNFQPAISLGLPQEAIYFLRLQFPSYDSDQFYNQNDVFKFVNSSIDNFENIDYTGERIDILFGLATNIYSGKISEHLSMGGGMKIDMLYQGRKGYGIGFGMSIFGNKLIEEYDVPATTKQSSGPAMMFLTLFGTKTLSDVNGKVLLIQLEASYSIQNVISKEDSQEDFTQFKGFSPGLQIHYFVPLGKQKPAASYVRPTINQSQLNFHLGIRPVMLDHYQAKGWMYELGVALRWTSRVVKRYRLKQRD